MGVCRRVLQILTLFQPKKISFYRPVFRPDLQNPYSFSDLAFVVRIRIFLLRCYSFGIETINTFIRSRSTNENHTRFQTKIGTEYPFSGQNGAKTRPDGAAHTYIAYIREYPRGSWHRFNGEVCIGAFFLWNALYGLHTNSFFLRNVIVKAFDNLRDKYLSFEG